MSARDPVCGEEVDTLRARAVAIVDGRTYYFCSAKHKAEFLADRGRFESGPTERPVAPERPPPPERPAAPERIVMPDRRLPEAEPADVADGGEEAGPVDGEADPGEPGPRRSRPLVYVAIVLALAAAAIGVAVLSKGG